MKKALLIGGVLAAAVFVLMIATKGFTQFSIPTRTPTSAGDAMNMADKSIKETELNECKGIISSKKLDRNSVYKVSNNGFGKIENEFGGGAVVEYDRKDSKRGRIDFKKFTQVDVWCGTDNCTVSCRTKS